MEVGNIRILDLTRLLPGPYATQILADMGAEVIKVEDTAQGDYARDLEVAETTRLFESVNGGKQSITIDLSNSEGREVFYDIVAEADVVVEQFRPGVVERLGVDYETLTEYNDELIYCSISGYGQTGPNRNVVGHDLNYVGFSGLLDLTRPEADATPTLPGFPIGDMSGGLFAACNILHRLLARELLESPGGDYIDVAMSDAVLSLSQMVGVSALDTPFDAGETLLTGKYPCYNVYRTADDEFLTIGALEPKFWEEFCSAIDRPDLIEAHVSEDQDVRDRVKEELETTLQQRPIDAWEEMFASYDVPVSRVQSLPDAYESSQTTERGLLTPVEDTKRVLTPGLGDCPVDSAASETPAQGEHTRSILADAGYTESEIDELVANDVI
jgi:crotonobetainyl-CoA:carnitine CoA-transferase CaiB-like acyl-CoA transferase